MWVQVPLRVPNKSSSFRRGFFYGTSVLWRSPKDTSHQPILLKRVWRVVADWLRRWVYFGLVVQMGALFMRDGFWWADLLSHFALFASLVVLITMVIEAGRRHWRHLGLLGIGFGVLMVYVSAYLQRAPLDDAGASDLRVMSFNVLTSNPDKASVLGEIQCLDPDVVVAIEVDAQWIAALSAFTMTHPHRIESPRSDNFGIACYSRFPLEPVGTNQLQGLPIVDVRVHVDDTQTIRLLGIHTLPPMNKPSWERTRAMARDLVQNLNPAEPTVVCGDFNAAPTSAIWQDLIAGDVLRPAGRGRALLPTWGLFGLGALQLDHLFIAGPLVVTEDELGDFSGSDHKPVLSGFRLK